MPSRLEVKRKFSVRANRVKSVEIHSTEPWILMTLFDGHAHIYNHETQHLIKTFVVAHVPVRTGKFIPRKDWIVFGSDDMYIRVYNYRIFECVYQFEAHFDYIRSLAVHPTQSFLLTSSDDMTIKLWDWNDAWALKQTFEEHRHFIMQIMINPKESNTFASASLDCTIKLWQLDSNESNCTLIGHEKGVNCIDYYSGSERPYLVSGGDDFLVKIWDYQNKTCVQTLTGHSQNVNSVAFHPELPMILSGSEDCTIKLWHLNTYRLEFILKYGLDRCWAISCLKGSKNVAIGYDAGTIMIGWGRDEPAISMDASTGRILWTKYSEIQQVNLKQLVNDQPLKDGDPILFNIKNLGSCEIYSQTLSHSPNGRFVAVCGGGEYIVYTAFSLRYKSCGSAMEFVWSNDSSEYAIRDGNIVKIFKDFKEIKAFKPDLNVEGIFGGHLLGVRLHSDLIFYDWQAENLMRRIDVISKNVYWNGNGEFVCIAAEECFYILRCNLQAFVVFNNDNDLMFDNGIENAFDALHEIPETIKTGLWIGNCFVYTNSFNRLNYCIDGDIVTIAHLDRVMYLIGYMSQTNRLYLADKDMSIVSFQLPSFVVESQTAVIGTDFHGRDQILLTIPNE